MVSTLPKKKNMAPTRRSRPPKRKPMFQVLVLVSGKVTRVYELLLRHGLNSDPVQKVTVQGQFEASQTINSSTLKGGQNAIRINQNRPKCPQNSFFGTFFVRIFFGCLGTSGQTHGRFTSMKSNEKRFQIFSSNFCHKSTEKITPSRS